MSNEKETKKRKYIRKTRPDLGIKRCCVKNCDLVCSELELKDRNFHYIPRHPEIKKRWLNQLKVTEKDITFRSLVCSRHFTCNDYTHTLTHLKKNVLPTLNLNCESVVVTTQNQETFEIRIKEEVTGAREFQEMSENAEQMETNQDVPMEDDDMEDEGGQEDEEIAEEDKEVYLPGKPLAEDEELICDESAYIILHSASTGAPCLSFDVIPDNLGDNRESFPMSCYMVSGTQAAASYTNQLIIMKMHNLHRTSKEKEKDSDLESDEDDSSSDEEEDEEKKPKMTAALIKHVGSVNRIRSTKVRDKNLAASWSENGKVYLYDITPQLQAVDDQNLLKQYEESNQSELTKPLFTFRGHTTEGYGIDWCSTEPGVLATGDCHKDIHIWKPTDDGTWLVNQRPLIGHTKSVEDIQWSPNERHVLATCSVDKSIRIWDTRAAPASACMLTCENSHESDVNVISWNRTDPLIASGGDDGMLHIWDLRQFQTKKPIATFKHHTNHITTVEWNPKESTVLASGGADDQIALWDLAVEKDDTQKVDDATLNNLPPQLLFIHQGQKEVKELHWHPQLTGVILSTAHSGFNVFRTISV